MTTITELFERHAALAFEKQLALGELLGEHDWWLDLNAGTISFSQRYTFPMQVLGTESEQSHTWLWAWANRQSNIPPRLLAAASALHDLGVREQITTLIEAQLSLDQISGHELAMLASGVTQADGYYRCPYEGGAAYVLISAPEIAALLSNEATRIISVFTQLIGIFALDHRRTLQAYLETKGYRLNASGNVVNAVGPQGATLRAVFDAVGRVQDLQASGAAH